MAKVHKITYDAQGEIPIPGLAERAQARLTTDLEGGNRASADVGYVHMQVIKHFGKTSAHARETLHERLNSFFDVIGSQPGFVLMDLQESVGPIVGQYSAVATIFYAIETSSKARERRMRTKPESPYAGYQRGQRVNTYR